MMNKFKFLLIAVFALAVLAGPATAAIIVETESVLDPSYTPFFIAYEVYNNALGINADNVPVVIRNGAAITSAESKNLRVFNGKINLSGQNVFLLSHSPNFDPAAGLACDDGVTLVTISTDVLAGTELIIGESAVQGVPSADVSVLVYDPQTFCVRNAAILGQTAATTVAAGALVISPNGFIEAGLGTVDPVTQVGTITLPNALNFNVNPNLNPTCAPPFPVVQLAYIAQNETSPVTTILVIRPQFTGVNFVTGLNAELDTDFDFQQFVLGSGPNVIAIDEILGPAFRIDNGQALSPGVWKAFIPGDATGSISFDLNSVNPENGLSIAILDADVLTNCVANATNTVWSCGLSNEIADFTNSPGFINFDIIKNTAVESVPTVWTISNATIQISGGAVTTACFAPAGQVGVWFGGLEAFVPFVKGDPATGYETFIKLFNRYNKPAKLFAKTFKNADLTGDSNSMLVSTEQIVGFEEIPANGMITLTSVEIGSLIPGYDMSLGIPVKFLIRVPSQTGSTTYEGIQSGTVDLVETGAYDGTHSGSALHTNNNDPFVEGIVVSVIPGGGQRTIPLKFKSFKNGEYNH